MLLSDADAGVRRNALKSVAAAKPEGLEAKVKELAGGDAAEQCATWPRRRRASCGSRGRSRTGAFRPGACGPPGPEGCPGRGRIGGGGPARWDRWASDEFVDLSMRNSSSTAAPGWLASHTANGPRRVRSARSARSAGWPRAPLKPPPRNDPPAAPRPGPARLEPPGRPEPAGLRPASRAAPPRPLRRSAPRPASAAARPAPRPARFSTTTGAGPTRSRHSAATRARAGSIAGAVTMTLRSATAAGTPPTADEPASSTSGAR